MRLVFRRHRSVATRLRSRSNVRRLAFEGLERRELLTTFNVTSNDLTGPGSLLKAVELANQTPGLDTIQFEPGLQIDLTNGPLSGELGVVRLTESAVIDGAHSTVFSTPVWISSAGDINNDSTVDNPFTIEASPSMRFLQVGTVGEDNSGIEVTVRNLKAEQLNQFARGELNSSLTVENVEMTGFRAVTHPEDSFIQGTFRNLTIRDTAISRSKNFGELVYAGDSAFIFVGGIGGSGDLVMENVTMIDNYSAGAILWTGGSATIVSSRFVASGGIQMFDTNATIVNSVFDLVSSDENSNSIFAGAASQIDLIASTVRVEFHGDPPSSSGVEFNGRPLLASGGHITLKGSAVYGGQADSEFGQFPGIAYYATQGGTLSADNFSWVSPVDDQSSEALKLLFQNPNLRTEAPGLSTDLFEAYPQSVTPLLGTPEDLGALIDVIPEAGTGGANELVNPIDGQPILLDALGNPRVDGNDRRNIGAVQLTLAPHLTLDATGDGSATLSWSQPLDSPTGPITGYTVFYREAGLGSWTEVAVPSPAITGFTVAGLTNGVTYEFEVAAVKQGGVGPRSNLVEATPYGAVQPPQPVATPGVYQVELNWAVPAAGGYAISGYGVYYRLTGAATWTYFGETTDTSVNVTGLQPGTDYEFGLKTKTTAGQLSSQLGTTAASTLDDLGELFTNLREQVDLLCDSGVLNQGQCRSLLVKLDRAELKVSQNKVHVAINQLNALNQEVTGYGRGSVLTTEETDRLLDPLDRLIEDLQSLWGN